MIKWKYFSTSLALTCLAASGAASAEKVIYAYDALGRLTGATTSNTASSNATTSIGYDPAGNRSAYTVAGASGTAPAQPATMAAPAGTGGDATAVSATDDPTEDAGAVDLSISPPDGTDGEQLVTAAPQARTGYKMPQVRLASVAREPEREAEKRAVTPEHEHE